MSHSLLQVVINYYERVVLKQGLMEAKYNLVLITGTFHPSMTAKLILFLHGWFTVLLASGL